MTKQRAAAMTAAIGAGLLFATAGLHLNAYSFIVAQAPADLRSLIAALWVFCGASLIISALLTIAATPLFIVRRRALLGIAALIPATIATLQLLYLGFMAPTALLLFDAAVLVAAGELGRAYQPRPGTIA
jgi:energy-converting hydrogenase Eha subunit H